MPDYKAEFDSMVALLVETDPSQSDLLASQLRAEWGSRWRTIIKEHRDARGASMPSFYFDYVENPLLNLQAAYSRPSHCGYIAIYSAAVPIVFDLFYRLLSHPKVLPTVGNAGAESDRGNLGLFIDYRTILANRPPSRQLLSDLAPLDAERRQYAHWLAEIALTFLMLHELAHITLGHCEHAGGGSPLVELAATGPSSGGLGRQAFEIAADCAASLATYLSLLVKVSDRHKAERAMMEKGTTLVVPDQLIIFDWVFAIYVMFWAFGQEIDLSRLDIATHPPAPRRATRAFNCVYAFLKREIGEDARQQMARECERGINAGAIALDQISGGALRPKLDQYQILEENGTMNAHLQRIVAEWDKIKTDIKKYQHGDM
jgi:hypothetical protein